MFLSLHATQGLNALGIIAASANQKPVPTTSLARHIGLCLSSTEIIVKQLKNGGLICSYRGPGGGYQLQQPVKDLSVWDVVSCFKDHDPPANTGQGSPESDAALALASELKEAVCQHLQAYPLTDVLAQLPPVEPDKTGSRAMHTAFHLKPLHQSAHLGLQVGFLIWLSSHTQRMLEVLR